MVNTEIIESTIIRTERGLTVAGTRITLYDIMGYLKTDWPPSLIQHWLDLTSEQMHSALAYIAEHRNEVETEYQLVLEHAALNRIYWEERTQKVRTAIASLPPKPGQEALYTKLQIRKTELGLQ